MGGHSFHDVINHNAYLAMDYSSTPMDDFSVSVPGGIDTLGYLLAHFSIILCKLPSVLGCEDLSQGRQTALSSIRGTYVHVPLLNGIGQYGCCLC